MHIRKYPKCYPFLLEVGLAYMPRSRCLGTRLRPIACLLRLHACEYKLARMRAGMHELQCQLGKQPLGRRRARSHGSVLTAQAASRLGLQAKPSRQLGWQEPPAALGVRCGFRLRRDPARRAKTALREVYCWYYDSCRPNGDKLCKETCALQQHKAVWKLVKGEGGRE